MNTADLHQRYRAELAEARQKDNEEAGRIFLTVNIPIGRFWLAPLTLERYLFLEQVKSPFLGFCTEENLIPTKEDVLQFLWIMSPDFRPSQKAGRWFGRRNYFIRWRKYALEIYELIAAEMEAELENAQFKKQEEASPPSSWIATLIDGAASQYGWGERDILNLPLNRAKAYMEAMSTRLSMGTGNSPEFNRHADKVRHEYVKKFQIIADQEKEESHAEI
jgi:hypothetical protein